MNRFFRHTVSLLFLAALAFAGCQSDEKFTSDTRYTLELSDDTISVDTVLVSVRSASRQFRIYNPNGVGIRLSAVMAGGSSSSFSMNIDGRNSNTVTDLEILPQDSIFGFINVTPSTQDLPGGMPMALLRDSIILEMESGNTMVIQLNAMVQNAIFLKKKTISADTVFTAELPYVIYDTLRIAPGATLSMAPGTRLLFHDKAGLQVQGRLIAIGTADSMVTFRTDRLDRLFSNLPYDLTAGGWNGIDIAPESTGNIFDFCDIHGSMHGIKADSTENDMLKFLLTNSIIHNIEGTAIQAAGCSIKVANSQITNAKGYCVDIYGGVADFTFCTLANCYLWSSNSGGVKVSDYMEGGIATTAKATFNSCILTASGSWGLTADLKNTGDTIPEAGRSICVVRNSLVLIRDTTTVIPVSTIFEDRMGDIHGALNFRKNTDNPYESTFQLDSLSAARCIADTTAVREWPTDLSGTARPTHQAPDAGCYQFIKQ